MDHITEIALRGALVGTGATATMDLWAAVLRRFGVPSLDFALLGRWIGHVPEGVFRHDRIADAVPVRHERALGWAAHYSIGIGFAVLHHLVFGLEWGRNPSLVPALAFGVATVAAPLFVLQPALGAGIASRRTPRPVFNASKSVATHLVYGLGLYLSATALAAIVHLGN